MRSYHYETLTLDQVEPAYLPLVEAVSKFSTNTGDTWLYRRDDDGSLCLNLTCVKRDVPITKFTPFGEAFVEIELEDVGEGIDTEFYRALLARFEGKENWHLIELTHTLPPYEGADCDAWLLVTIQDLGETPSSAQFAQHLVAACPVPAFSLNAHALENIETELREAAHEAIARLVLVHERVLHQRYGLIHAGENESPPLSATGKKIASLVSTLVGLGVRRL